MPHNQISYPMTLSLTNKAQENTIKRKEARIILAKYIFFANSFS